ATASVLFQFFAWLTTDWYCCCTVCSAFCASDTSCCATLVASLWTFCATQFVCFEWSPWTITSNVFCGLACASLSSPGEMYAVLLFGFELSAPAIGEEMVVRTAAMSAASRSAAPREPPPQRPFERVPLFLPPQ